MAEQANLPKATDKVFNAPEKNNGTGALRILAQIIAQKFVAERHHSVDNLVHHCLQNDDLKLKPKAK